MRRLDAELLADRARDLQANGLNGLELVFVGLAPAAAPTHAELTVEFQNSIAVAAIVITTLYIRLTGGADPSAEASGSTRRT